MSGPPDRCADSRAPFAIPGARVWGTSVILRRFSIIISHFILPKSNQPLLAENHSPLDFTTLTTGDEGVHFG